VQLSKALAPGQAEEVEALLVAMTPSEGDQAETRLRSRSRLEQFKAMPRKESPEALLALLDQLTEIRSLGLTGLSDNTDVHPATRRLLASWGYRYDVWNLRRFAPAKRHAIVLCFLQAARAESTDAIVEMQDKLITAVHSKARQRYDDLLRATEEARNRAVEVLEDWDRSYWTIRFPIMSSERPSSHRSPALMLNVWWRDTERFAGATRDPTWDWWITGMDIPASIRPSCWRGRRSSLPSSLRSAAPFCI
jgi:hypothetical protein